LIFPSGSFRETVLTRETSPSDATNNDVNAILERYRFLVHPAIQETIEQLTAGPGRMAGYALGLCEADGTPRRTLGGKGLRPAITMLCAQAAGGEARAGIAGAVAVELVHAFSLVHDDIIDRDERRRHRPTVWKTYGIGPAILSGDALLALAVSTLAAEGAGSATAHLSAALIDLVRGQADDMAFEDRPYDGPGAVTVEEYQDMAARKTGALLGCAAAIGTTLGGGNAALAEAMTQMGRHLGVAFQAIDDVLGISGDPAVTGKPVFSDLRQGKKTLPIVYALQSDTAAGRRLASLLTDRPPAPATLRHAADLIDASGGRAFAYRVAAHHLETALTLISTSGLREPAAGQLSTLATFLIDRAY